MSVGDGGCERCNGRGFFTEYRDVPMGTNAIRRTCPDCSRSIALLGDARLTSVSDREAAKWPSTPSARPRGDSRAAYSPIESRLS